MVETFLPRGPIRDGNGTSRDSAGTRGGSPSMAPHAAGTLDPAAIRVRLLTAAAGSTPVAVFAVDERGIVVFAEGGGLRRLTGGRTKIEGLAAVDAFGETPMLVAGIGQALGGVRFAANLNAGEHRYAVRVLPLASDDRRSVPGAAGLAVEAAPSVLDAAGSGVSPILEALVESTPLSVWVLDPRGDVVRDNAYARELGLGVLRNARESAPGSASLIGRVLLEGLESRGLARVRDASGRPADLPVRAIPLRNANGSTVGAIVLAPPPSTLPAAPPSTTGMSLASLLGVSSAAWDPIPGDALAAHA